MPALHVLETVLYAPNLAEATAFYTDVLRLRIVFGPIPLMVALRVDDDSVLLLFDPQQAGAPGRDIPRHGTTGPGHVAFAVDTDEELHAILEQCADAGAPVEHEERWPAGGTSWYVRDPAGNSVEFVRGPLWPA